MSKLLFIVVGARPNFIKIAPIIKELDMRKTNYQIIHTGQHYDKLMSDIFFEDLKIPEPDINFNVKSTYHGQQISKMISMFEILCYKKKPNCIMVVGDVNSTLAAALVTSKMNNVKLVHVESGERSYDKSMPEEINRVITDHLSDYLFCTGNTASHNLSKEGIDKDKIHIVGNTMIDNLINHLQVIKNYVTNQTRPYIIVTLHRASNTDDLERLKEILQAIQTISTYIHIVFPIHPRTAKKIEQFKLQKYLDNVEVRTPMSCLKFLSYVNGAKVVLTDSGGLQIEAAFLNVPCITMRYNTEHINTISQNVNILVGSNREQIYEAVSEKLITKNKTKYKDPLFDGQASKRMVKILGENNLI